MNENETPEENLSIEKDLLIEGDEKKLWKTLLEGLNKKEREFRARIHELERANEDAKTLRRMDRVYILELEDRIKKLQARELYRDEMQSLNKTLEEMRLLLKKASE